MAPQEGYDVLRLIECGRICYVSSEYVNGRPLVWRLKYHPNLSKDQLFSWIMQLTKQLGMIHRCRKNPCYRYVNPYSIIVSEEGELYFADMDAGANESLLRLMRKKCIREHFLPPEEPYYQKTSVALDAYGLGKTIQYLLASAEVDPPLTRREERRLKRMISKCLKRKSKKPIQSISEIRKYIPEPMRQASRCKTIIFRVLCITVLFLCGLGAAALLFWKPESGAKEQNISVQKETQKPLREERIEECLELAAAYFLEMENYTKTVSVLEGVRRESEFAKAFQKVSEALIEENAARMKAMLPVYLKQMEECLELEAYTEREKLLYRQCIIQGYGILDSRDGAEEILRLGGLCMEAEGLTDFDRQKVQIRLARAYELIEENEQAAGMYLELLETEEETDKRETYYKKAAMLYEASGRADLALDVCVRGIEDVRQSQDLKLLHLQLLCADPGTERALCVQTVREYLQEEPGLERTEEFKKLQTDYGIRVEGGEVWVEE